MYIIETLEEQAKVRIDVKNSNLEKTMFNNWNSIKGVLLNFGFKLTENIIWQVINGDLGIVANLVKDLQHAFFEQQNQKQKVTSVRL